MADNQLKATLIALSSSLAKQKVEYMLVGGTAVALYGHYRPSADAKGEIADKPDIDLWYNPSYTNYFNVLKVLQNLGHDVTALEEEQTPNPREAFIKLEFDNFTFDLLPKIRADVKFYEAYQRRRLLNLEGTVLSVIGMDDLIADKRATGRLKDIEDIKQLKELRGF